MLQEQETQPIKKTRNRAKKPKGTTVKTLSTAQLLNMKFETVNFSERFQRSYPALVLQGPWFYYGNPSQGKTSHIVQVLRELLNFGKADFYTLEERASKSLQDAWIREKIKEAPNKVQIFWSATLQDIKDRLRKKGSAKIIFIDSVQYLRLKAGEYEAFKEEFPDVLDIWISHAQGNDPRGQRAVDIHFDAFVKVHVKGYMAYITIRGYGPTEPFDIYPEKSKKFNAKGLLNPIKTQE